MNLIGDAAMAIVLIVLLFILSGCGATTGLVTETIDGVTTTTASAIVARGDSLNNLLKNRDDVQGQMHERSGVKVKIKFSDKQYKLEGGGLLVVHAPDVIEIEARENGRFDQLLPTEPKDHRVWKSVDNFVDKALLAFGIYSLANWGMNGQDNSGTHYNGPYAADSYNPITTTHPYVMQ